MSKTIKLFCYRQNNSGGSFYEPAHKVYVEADSLDEAAEIADGVGIYFNGCDSGQDCNCCGDRWYYRADEMEIEFEDEDDLKAILFEKAAFLKERGVPSSMIVFKDGRTLVSEN